MRKILLILVVCLCFCSCAEKGKMTKEQAVSSEVLQEQQAEVFESVTKDFDGNGTEETFQLRREGKMLKLWFVGDGEEIPLVQEENFVEYGPAQQNLWAYELSDRAFCVAGESDTARSVVYIVCDGVAIEQEIGKVSDFSQQEDGSFVGTASALDVGYSVAEQKTVWGGRTIKPYWFYWDGMQFVEYSAQKLCWEQLADFDGLQKQVEQRLAQWNQQQFPQGFVQIDGEEIPAHWKVYDIWLRENGIININYGYDYLSSNGNGGGGRRYDTFLIEQETARLMDSGEGIYRVSAHE
ncbi:hypothetical protein [Negativibacillus massiliensis]|uniref:hypothetical protein n=1 Tax=Negativibacillus massiliensis TaxID=1871035 RepID=UPI00033A5A36|nr:hypothetical protein [Negativibacillus massiliensis]CDA79398.1 putative uncharacterized protein [Clostridium sp. CAG:242]